MSLEVLFPNYDRKHKDYLQRILDRDFKPMDKSIKESLIRQFEGV